MVVSAVRLSCCQLNVQVKFWIVDTHIPYSKMNHYTPKKVQDRVQMLSRSMGAVGSKAVVMPPTPQKISTRTCGKMSAAVEDRDVYISELEKKVAELRQNTTDEDRSFWSLLPPVSRRVTRMEQVQEKSGLYFMTQPLKPPGNVPDIRLHMGIVELSDGTLALIGALAPTRELVEQLSLLDKPVSHIILPNTSPEHWYYGPALSRAFPEALLWVVSGFMQGKGVPLPGRSFLFKDAEAKGVLREIPKAERIGQDEEDGNMPEFPHQDIEAVILDVPFFIEAAVHLKTKKVLMLADTGIKLDADDSEYANINQQLAESLGVWDKLGPITKVVQQRYKKEAREWSRRIIDECDFDLILAAHGTAVVCNGKQEFEQCFSFLFDDEN